MAVTSSANSMAGAGAVTCESGSRAPTAAAESGFAAGNASRHRPRSSGRQKARAAAPALYECPAATLRRRRRGEPDRSRGRRRLPTAGPTSSLSRSSRPRASNCIVGNAEPLGRVGWQGRRAPAQMAGTGSALHQLAHTGGDSSSMPVFHVHGDGGVLERCGSWRAASKPVDRIHGSGPRRGHERLHRNGMTGAIRSTDAYTTGRARRSSGSPARPLRPRSTVLAVLDAAFAHRLRHRRRALCDDVSYWRLEDRSLLARLLGQPHAGDGRGAAFPVRLTVTHVDGLVLARSGFHHSVNYRSVMASPWRDREQR